MAERSWFFNSAPGDPRVYQASDFARYFGKVLSTGLLHEDNVPGLSVKTSGSDLRTYVEPGSAIMEGYAYENSGNEYLTHGLPEIDMNRIDRVVLRLDKRNNSRYIRLFVKDGTPAINPEPPSLTRDGSIWELSLAQVLVRANTSSINPADILDERLDRQVAGLVYSLISKPQMADIGSGNYSARATVAGQRDFVIPNDTFDKDGDGLTVYLDGKKVPEDAYTIVVPRTVRFNSGLPIGSLVEFTVIRGVVKLPTDYPADASDVGIIDAGGYYEETNVEGALQKIGAALFTPQPKVYGVKIDINNQDPQKAVERIGDSASFSSSADFNNVFPFNKIKPCLLRNGEVIHYLDPNDFSKNIDGSPVEINNYLMGDVMIEFPLIYWNLEKDSNFQYIQYSEARVNSKFQPLAHQDGIKVNDKLYVAAYAGSTDAENKLRSVSGKSAAKNRSLSSYRDSARLNGNHYEVMNYYQILMIQILYIVQYADRRTLNWFSPSGFVDLSGSLNKSGMNVTKPSNGPVKYVGLEQILTNSMLKLDGYYHGTSSIPQITSDNTIYNDLGAGYERMNFSVRTSSNSYTRDIIGSNKGGFLPLNVEGSSTTGYADLTETSATGALHFGNGIIGGFFSFRTGTAEAISDPSTYARLVYLK